MAASLMLDQSKGCGSLFRNLSLLERGVLLVFVFALLGAGVLLSTRWTISAMILYAFIALLGLAFAIYAIWFFGHSGQKTFLGIASYRLCVKLLLVSILLGLCFECLTLVGALKASPLVLVDWSFARAAFFGLLSFVALTAAVSGIECIPDSKEAWLRLARSVPAFFCAVALLGLVAAIACELLFDWRTSTFRMVYLAVTVVLVVGLAWLIRKKISYEPERLFLVIALMFGSYLSFALPRVTGVSWDDQIHYARSLSVSYVSNAEYTDSDVALSTLPWAGRLGPHDANDMVDGLDEDYRNSIDEGTVKRASGFDAVDGSSIATISSLGYIPSAAGLWLGRLFHFVLSSTLVLGRWFNLIFYVAIMAWAIRIIPVKKVLLSVVGLIPTSLFLASSFSYDPWVICWLCLGVAYLVREIIEKDRPLEAKGIAKIALPFMVGLCPKAIYFPILGLLFLMPRCKFSSKSARTSFYATVVFLGLLAAASFVLPMFFSSASQQGDLRGGSDVNAIGQIHFILEDPIRYASILAGFLLNYFSPVASDGYTIGYAYMGDLNQSAMFMTVSPFILLVLTAFLDDLRCPLELKDGGKLWSLFVLVITFVLVATAMYVSFTPVGSGTINGCQVRYILPMLFVALAFLEVSPKGRIELSGGYLAPQLLMAGCTVVCCAFLVV